MVWKAECTFHGNQVTDCFPETLLNAHPMSPSIDSLWAIVGVCGKRGLVEVKVRMVERMNHSNTLLLLLLVSQVGSITLF